MDWCGSVQLVKGVMCEGVNCVKLVKGEGADV